MKVWHPTALIAQQSRRKQFAHVVISRIVLAENVSVEKAFAIKEKANSDPKTNSMVHQAMVTMVGGFFRFSFNEIANTTHVNTSSLEDH